METSDDATTSHVICDIVDLTNGNDHSNCLSMSCGLEDSILQTGIVEPIFRGKECTMTTKMCPT
jgi:hypothetical protein